MLREVLKGLIIKNNAVLYTVENWVGLVLLCNELNGINIGEFVRELERTNKDVLEAQINSECKLSKTELMEKIADNMYILDLDFSVYPCCECDEGEMTRLLLELDGLMGDEGLGNIKRMVDIFRNISLLSHENIGLLYDLLSSGVDIKSGITNLSFNLD